MALTDKLTNIADAIRGKTGGTDPLTLDEMAASIAGIETGGGDTSNEDGLITRTLAEYSNDRVTTIGSHAFSANATIESVSFPNVKRFEGSNNFDGCKALRSAHFPKLEFAGGGNAFKNCSALLEARFPNYSANEGSSSFAGCSSLKLVEYGALRGISNGSFGNCTALETLIFRDGSQITSLVNIGAFLNTPFAVGGTGGTVYVSSELIESYQTATNWSVLYEAGTCNFVAIEGSEYE